MRLPPANCQQPSPMGVTCKSVLPNGLFSIFKGTLFSIIASPLKLFGHLSYHIRIGRLNAGFDN